jgi:hypothetical protein
MVVVALLLIRVSSASLSLISPIAPLSFVSFIFSRDRKPPSPKRTKTSELDATPANLFVIEVLGPDITKRMSSGAKPFFGKFLR